MKKILCLFFICFLASSVHGADFEHSYALVIGINNYGEQLNKLRNAEADAEAVAIYLQSQGYTVHLLTGSEAATKENVERKVDSLAGAMKEDSRFLFFFAGHGKTETIEGVDVAYLVLPVSKSVNAGNNLISSGDISRYSKKLGVARHQLFIFDSCYSGLMGMLDTRTSPKNHYNSEDYLLDSLKKRKVRQFLAAGGAYQEVLDGGPNNLSWFTYFVLKALHPNQASFRPSGLITFSEFASFVQTRSANPRHTPAFGSLAGHEGGEYLFRDYSKSNPTPELLRDINADTLYKLGFLTRAEDQNDVASLLPSIKLPIENLYHAWRTLDIDLYIDQFSPDAVQTGIYKSGKTYSRGFAEISEKRRQMFPLLDSVEVSKFELMYQGYDGDIATLGVRYSMELRWKSGKITQEKNINECYQVKKSSSDQRWRIIRNDDYQKQICRKSI